MSADKDTYSQCLLFIVHKAKDSVGRKVRNSSGRSKRLAAEVPPTTKGFVLVPEVLKKNRPEVLDLFERNDLHPLDFQNVSAVILEEKDEVEVIELAFLESPSASLDPLTIIVTDNINRQVVRLLLPSTTVSFPRKNPETVRCAVSEQNLTIVEQLLAQKAYIRFRNDRGSRLHLAAQWEFTSLVSSILELEADINVRSHLGNTALHIAAREGRIPVVKLLLDRGADIQAIDNRGKTPLHAAAENGHVSVVELLLDRGAEIQAQDEYRFTPLHLTAIEGHGPITQLLLDHGADIELRDKNGCTVLLLSCLVGLFPIVQLLLKNGAIVDQKDIFGDTPLHCAVEQGHLDIVQILLLNNADVNSKSNRGRVPIFYAAQRESIELVDILLKFGARISVKDEKNRSVLMYAFESKHPTLVLHLLESRFLDPESLRESSIIKYCLILRRMIENLSVSDQNLFKNLSSVLALHIVKIAALNLRDVVEDIDASPLWSDSFPTPLSDFKTQCLTEVTSMKGQTIGDTAFSFHSLLTKDLDKMACSFRNTSLDHITDAQLQEMFPIYGSILAHHFRNGRERRSMVMEGIKIFNYLFSPDFKQLPLEIKEKIVTYLNYKDLSSLKVACQPSKKSST